MVATAVALLMPLWANAAAKPDPARAAAYTLAMEQAKKTLEQQIAVQGLNTTGHIWIKEEVEATANFQRQFDEYLNTFHDALAYAAEIYGIYYEVTQTAKNIKNISNILAESPENALAVAFSAKRNKVYRNLVLQSIDIIMDIRKVTLESSKMTEQERDKIISMVRPKLHKINKSLSSLTLALRYTSLMTVWDEITGRVASIDPQTKTEVIKRCRRTWFNNAKSVK